MAVVVVTSGVLVGSAEPAGRVHAVNISAAAATIVMVRLI